MLQFLSFPAFQIPPLHTHVENALKPALTHLGNALTPLALHVGKMVCPVVEHLGYKLFPAITKIEEQFGPLDSLVERVSTQANIIIGEQTREFCTFVTRRTLYLHTTFSHEKLQAIHTQACETLKTLPDGKIGKVVSLQREVGITLKGVEITTNPQDVPSRQKWIIYFLPRGTMWEQELKKLIFLSSIFKSEDGVNIICFNYRGLCSDNGNDAPRSENDFIQDGRAIVAELLRRGVLPQNMLLHGFSLGGGVATQVAALTSEEGMKIALCNERSFTSLPDVLKEMVPIAGSKLGKIVARTGWRLDSQAAMHLIKGKVLVLSHPKDFVIQTDAQFRRCITSSTEEIIMTDENEIDLPSQIYNKLWAHGRTWNDSEVERYVAFARNVFKPMLYNKNCITLLLKNN